VRGAVGKSKNRFAVGNAKSLWAMPVYMWKKLGKTVEKDVASADHILRNAVIATKSACRESG